MFDWNKKEKEVGIVDNYYTVEQAAEKLGITTQTMRKQIEECRIPIEKFAGSVAILKSDIAIINKYKILAYIREVTGVDEPYLCKECENRILGL